jgi:hypothetical protein
MGQVLHGCATTTEAIRRAIQHSQESLRSLSRRYGINPKTVAKWKKRGFVADLPTGPREPKSTVLSIEYEAIVVAFRRHTLLPLDDCLYALQATIPHLTRSSLHRCLQRHGISRLPEVEDGNDEPIVGVQIVNSGPGPAVIKKETYYFDRKPLRDDEDPATYGKLYVKPIKDVQLEENDTLAVGEQQWLYYRSTKDKKELQGFLDFLDQRFAISVTFCSIDGACWSKCSTPNHCW